MIKCKLKMKQSLMPIFQCCEGFRDTQMIPTLLLESILSMFGFQQGQEKNRCHRIIRIMKKNCKRQEMVIEQFCSVLFEHSMISLKQLLEENFFFSLRWKIPEEFIRMAMAVDGQRVFETRLEEF